MSGSIESYVCTHLLVSADNRPLAVLGAAADHHHHCRLVGHVYAPSQLDAARLLLRLLPRLLPRLLAAAAHSDFLWQISTRR